jgi:PleD family two-component response regulator
MSEALKETIHLVDRSSQKWNKRGSINVKTRKKNGISIVGTSSREELATYNSQREILESNIQPSDFTKRNFDILIVDDSCLNRKMLCKLLRASGHVFDEAEDGLLVIEKVKAKMSEAANGSEKGCFSVILMDYIMPNMDGPTATKAIRDLGYTAPVFGK